MIGPLYYLSILSTVIPALASTFWFESLRQRRDQFLLWLFLCFSALTDVLVFALAIIKVHNVLIFHVYSLLEYLLVLNLLLTWQKSAKITKLIRYAIPLYFVIYFGLKIAGLEEFDSNSFNFLTRPIALLIMMAFILRTIYEIWHDAQTRLERDYRFWILIALAIYYSSSIILFSFTYTENRTLLLEIVYIHAILNIIHNILLTIGVFQVRRSPQPPANLLTPLPE